MNSNVPRSWKGYTSLGRKLLGTTRLCRSTASSTLSTAQETTVRTGSRAGVSST